MSAPDQRPLDAPFVAVDGTSMPLSELVARYEHLARDLEEARHIKRGLVRNASREAQLKPYQVELLKLQQHLEETERRMIVLFEGRDAAGKGGTIRRITRYMNEKHYRIVALGRPTEEQKSQWYFQKYVAQFPTGGEIVLFDRSWYNRAMVEPVFGFCTDSEYRNFIRGVVGFEKDLVRQGTVLVSSTSASPKRSRSAASTGAATIPSGSGSCRRSTCRPRSTGTTSPT